MQGRESEPASMTHRARVGLEFVLHRRKLPDLRVNSQDLRVARCPAEVRGALEPMVLRHHRLTPARPSDCRPPGSGAPAFVAEQADRTEALSQNAGQLSLDVQENPLGKRCRM